MKKQIAFLAVLCLSLFSSCKKETAALISADTLLEISIKDELGNKIQGASVALYSSESDFNEDKNKVSIQSSDVNGIVTFSNLTSKKYYWFAYKGCKNNIFGSVTTVNPITEKVKTTVTTVLGGNGSITLVNNSNNPYRIYINSQVYSDMNGQTTLDIPFVEIGTYNIRVLQLSGYSLYPTDKTYTGNVSCGGTLLTAFPN